MRAGADLRIPALIDRSSGVVRAGLEQFQALKTWTKGITTRFGPEIPPIPPKSAPYRDVFVRNSSTEPEKFRGFPAENPAS
jgi:hypothetical protein